ncbi:hypothetical protein TIFTF001_032600 [Ficus carica]|uniref:Uncharacterized protein n=1 Tax=Ficus carica TaxID=3494 RepID=A0AA88DXH4_FICCA|nr:hypothetical protein TIFTF001_032600 [Ficus carica]
MMMMMMRKWREIKLMLCSLFSYSLFVGEIPYEISWLTDLVSLDLSYSDAFGTSLSVDLSLGLQSHATKCHKFKGASSRSSQHELLTITSVIGKLVCL